MTRDVNDPRLGLSEEDRLWVRHMVGGPGRAPTYQRGLFLVREGTVEVASIIIRNTGGRVHDTGARTIIADVTREGVHALIRTGDVVEVWAA